jgi:hypothetical protein
MAVSRELFLLFGKTHEVLKRVALDACGKHRRRHRFILTTILKTSMPCYIHSKSHYMQYS